MNEIDDLDAAAAHEIAEDRRIAARMVKPRNREVLLRRAAVTEALWVEVRRLRAALADYENCISWDTTCKQCARDLDGKYHDYMHAEAEDGQR